MLFPVIQQATRYLKLQPVFLRKDVCALWAMLCRVMWNLFTVGSIQFSNDSTIASLEANQNRPKHCASSFLAMLSQTYLDNIDSTISLSNVVPTWLIQHCVGYFSHKHWFSAIGQHCTGNFLIQCCPRLIKTTLYRLSCEKMTVRSGPTLYK